MLKNNQQFQAAVSGYLDQAHTGLGLITAPTDENFDIQSNVQDVESGLSKFKVSLEEVLQVYTQDVAFAVSVPVPLLSLFIGRVTALHTLTKIKVGFSKAEAKEFKDSLPVVYSIFASFFLRFIDRLPVAGRYFDKELIAITQVLVNYDCIYGFVQGIFQHVKSEEEAILTRIIRDLKQANQLDDSMVPLIKSLQIMVQYTSVSLEYMLLNELIFSRLLALKQPSVTLVCETLMLQLMIVRWSSKVPAEYVNKLACQFKQAQSRFKCVELTCKEGLHLLKQQTRTSRYPTACNQDQVIKFRHLFEDFIVPSTKPMSSKYTQTDVLKRELEDEQIEFDGQRKKLNQNVVPLLTIEIPTEDEQQIKIDVQQPSEEEEESDLEIFDQ